MLCIERLVRFKMSFYDQFSQASRKFIGTDPESLNASNLEQLRQEFGEEWIKGYLKAFEVVAVNLADILAIRESTGERINTPHVVRTKLRDYWDHNKLLYISIVEQLSINQPDLKTDYNANEPK